MGLKPFNQLSGKSKQKAIVRSERFSEPLILSDGATDSKVNVDYVIIILKLCRCILKLSENHAENNLGKKSTEKVNHLNHSSIIQ